MEFNKVQLSAWELIQADARFLYTLVDIQQNAKNISSNYIMMCQPYIGIFTDGAEQWCKKMRLSAPMFSNAEKGYYTSLRLSHKFLEKSYAEYKKMLLEKFWESENYFYKIRSFREKVLGYYNVGTDLCNGEFCGNTILGALHTPIPILGNENAGNIIRDMSIIAGKLAAYFGCTEFLPYRYNDNLNIKYKNYHFYKNCPLKLKNDLGFVLFSILCNINYAIEFVEKYFVEEIPQKFKFAYLQYYYLCDFITDLNTCNATNFYLDTTLKNRDFRNCLAHYGLGQFLKECDIMDNDVLKGLTNKAFNLDYITAKKLLYGSLHDLAEQIKKAIC